MNLIKLILVNVILISNVTAQELAETKNWCDHLTPATVGTSELALDLSKAHRNVRFFGIHKSYRDVDQALASSFFKSKNLNAVNLSHYAKSIQSVCFVPKSFIEHQDIEATVSMNENLVAVVTPGTGDINIPAVAQAVIIDFTKLDRVKNLEEVLINTLQAALSEDLERFNKRMRYHQGLTSEKSWNSSIYSNNLFSSPQKDIVAKATSSRPLAIITSKQMPAIAVELALNLRLENRAWIVGSPLIAKVAQSQSIGIGNLGSLAYRRFELLQNGSPIADIVSYDYAKEELANLKINLAELTTIADPIKSGVKRNLLKAKTPYNDNKDFYWQTLEHSDVMAALIITHGALKLFFPYFHVVGNHIDERLLEVIKTMQNDLSMSPLRAINIMRRFGQILKDGHNFVHSTFSTPEHVGTIAALFEKINNSVVVRRSTSPKLKPGDTILSIDQTPMSEILRFQESITSAASDGYRFDLASREFSKIKKAATLEVMDTMGNKKTLVIEPQTFAALQKARNYDPGRKNGWINKDKKKIFYINLDGSSLKNTQQLNELLTTAKDAQGMVLDMRGYPGPTQYELVSRLSCDLNTFSPKFITPIVWGEKLRYLKQQEFPIAPSVDTIEYCGPVALLVGPRSVSAAENLSIMLTDAKRVSVVGRQTAATNGNITDLYLPGGITFSFTAMEIRRHDGSTFHGVGIQPDYEITPTPKDFKEGIDPVLNKAIEILNPS
ncbi:MAG: hypothetical protein ISR65_11165 [Bacteriovoracaceae bacterium]|nr:hypothetical protein [Bacteriovoracaceae bacterium]